MFCPFQHWPRSRPDRQVGVWHKIRWMELFFRSRRGLEELGASADGVEIEILKPASARTPAKRSYSKARQNRTSFHGLLLFGGLRKVNEVFTAG
jgi:hypothetical protein